MKVEDDRLNDNEEETIVYVAFENTSGTDTFFNEKLQLDMIGLDTEHPIIRINGRHYEGSYEDAVGTFMLFDKDNPIIDDSVFDKTLNLRYYTKTKKVLKMKRVFVKPRLEVLGDSNHPNCIPNIETIREAGVAPKYELEALNLWKKIRTERLKARNDYLEKQKRRKEKRQRGIEPDSDSDDDNPFVRYKNNKQHHDTDDDITDVLQHDIINHDRELTIDELNTSQDHFRDSNSKLTEVTTQLRNNKILQSSIENKVLHDNVTLQQVTECQNSTSKNKIFNAEKIVSSEIISEFEIARGGSTTLVNNDKHHHKILEINQEISEIVDSCKNVEENSLSGLKDDKPRSKQQKRAAKMQEISERFRKSACQIKLQTDKIKYLK